MSLLLKKFHLMNQGDPLAFTITLGTLNVWSYTWSTPTNYNWDAWGFDGGTDYYTYTTNKGSLTLASDQYVDGGSNTRTIDAIIWSEQPTGYFYFSLNGTSIPNTDTTFVSITVNGTVYTRSAGTYVASKNGGTHWWWEEAAPGTWGGHTGGTFDCLITL